MTAAIFVCLHAQFSFRLNFPNEIKNLDDRRKKSSSGDDSS